MTPRREGEILMMTKQAQLKKQAYESSLKSRALSILIYLIDRSNKELICFPAIPTMAKELHIGISTVKRALHQLVDAGFIQKESRFRDNNRGQTSNLYTLVFNEEVPNPTLEQEQNTGLGDAIEPDSQIDPVSGYRAEHLTFADLAGTVTTQEKTEPAPLPIPACTIEKERRFRPCYSLYASWTGAESILIPP